MTKYYSSFLPFVYILIYRHQTEVVFFCKKITAIQKNYYFCNVIKV